MDLDAFRQMVAKNPKGFLGRYGLGNKILAEGGNLEEAVEHLRVAVQLDPLHVASHLALGRALDRLQSALPSRCLMTAPLGERGVVERPDDRILLQRAGLFHGSLPEPQTAVQA